MSGISYAFLIATILGLLGLLIELGISILLRRHFEKRHSAEELSKLAKKLKGKGWKVTCAVDEWKITVSR